MDLFVSYDPSSFSLDFDLNIWFCVWDFRETGPSSRERNLFINVLQSTFLISHGRTRQSNSLNLKTALCRTSTFHVLHFQHTPFAVHYEKIRSLLRDTATNSAKIHSLARKYEHLRINQIQLRFLHFNQHSITLLGIHMRHWAYKREKYTFITYLVEGGGIQHFQITLKFWNSTANKFDV